MSDICLKCKHHIHEFEKNGACPIEVDKCEKEMLKHTISRLGNFTLSRCHQFEPKVEPAQVYTCFDEGLDCVWRGGACINLYHYGEFREVDNKNL